MNLAIPQQMAMIQKSSAKVVWIIQKNVGDIFNEGLSSPDCVAILVNCK